MKGWGEETEVFRQEGHQGVTRRYPDQTWPDYLPRCSGQRAAFCFLLPVFQMAPDQGLCHVGLLIAGCHIMSCDHAQRPINCSVVNDPEGVLWSPDAEGTGAWGGYKLRSCKGLPFRSWRVCWKAEARWRLGTEFYSRIDMEQGRKTILFSWQIGGVPFRGIRAGLTVLF